jgi:hypothetical protein
VVEDCRGVCALTGLMEGVGGTSDGGGGEASGGAVLADDGNGSGGIAIGRFIANVDSNVPALSATDADDGSPPLLLRDDAGSTASLELLADVLLAVVLLAAMLLAVVGAAPESMMTALLIRAKPMLVTFSPSLVRRCMALPASRWVWEPDG